MKTDLSQWVGFRLLFNPQTLELETDPEHFLAQSNRRVQDINEVLYAPNALPADHVLFYLYHLESAPTQEWKILDELDLAYGFTILPAQRIGREYVKTHGHSHPPAAGYSFSFPEIYAQISGRMWLFLQKHHPDDLSIIEECLLFDLHPGDAVVIPPNHAHMQINPSERDASVTAGLFSRLFKPEFAFYKQRKGFAYYLLDGGESYEACRNPLYDHAPTLRQLAEISGSPYEAVDPSQPVWTSLVRNPERYAFLSRPAETVRKFNLS